jgi:hypothetical protein
VFLWDLAVPQWPETDTWEQSVKATLEALLGCGCTVAWLGRQDSFWDPPCLFDPEFMSEGVLAAASSDGYFRCAVQLDAPLAWLSDKEMTSLREKSAGLAAAF